MNITIPIEGVIIGTLILFFSIRNFLVSNRLRRRRHEIKSILYDVLSHSRPDELVALYKKYTRKKNPCIIRFQSSVNYSVLRNLSEQHDCQQLVRLLISYQKVGQHTPVLAPMIEAAIKNLDKGWLQTILYANSNRFDSTLKSKDALDLHLFDLNLS